jgi:hypothetical protein
LRRFIIYLIPKYHKADQVKETEVDGACGTHGRSEESVNVLVVKPGGKKRLGRPRRRWEDEVRMDLRKIVLGGIWSEFIWFRIGTGDGLLLTR